MRFEAGDTVIVVDTPMHAPYYLGGEAGMIVEVSGSADYIPEHYTIQFENGSHILYGAELRREVNEQDVTYELK